MVLLGFALYAAGRIPWLGRLPGDFTFRRDGLTIYFPLVSCLLVSAVVSLILYFFRR